MFKRSKRINIWSLVFRCRVTTAPFSLKVDKIKGKRGKKVIEFGDQGIMSKSLAKIIIDVPIDFNEKDAFRVGDLVCVKTTQILPPALKNKDRETSTIQKDFLFILNLSIRMQ